MNGVDPQVATDVLARIVEQPTHRLDEKSSAIKDGWMRSTFSREAADRVVLEPQQLNLDHTSIRASTRDT